MSVVAWRNTFFVVGVFQGGEQTKDSPLHCYHRCLFALFRRNIYLFDRRDSEPQRLRLLRGAAELVRGEDEAGGAGRPGGETVGEGLIVFDVVLILQ